MLPSIYQFALAGIALISLFNTIAKFARGESHQTLFKLFLATLIWGSVLVFSLFPAIAHTLSITLGLGSNLNTLIFMGFVLVFGIVFKLIAIVERTERDISELVRQEALRNLKKYEE